MFDALDVGIVSFIAAALVKEWHITPQQVGLIGSMNSLGMAVGAGVAGVFADKLGRKPILLASILLFGVASGLSAFVTGLSIFLLLRFFIGAGLGAELPIASTYIAENEPTESRGRAVVLLESFWAVGWILSALLAYFVIPHYGWRTVLIICAIPALYTVFLRSSLPETKKNTSRTSFQQSMGRIWSKPYFRTTSMLWVLWFCVVFSYYGMFLWLPTVMVLKGYSLIKSFQYLLIMTLAQLPGYFSAAWLVERIGRKFVLVTYLIGTAVSAWAFGAAHSLSGLVAAGIFLSFFNLGAWGAMYAYTPEHYPDSIRATGTGFAAAVGRIGGILGPLFVGFAVSNHFSFSQIFGLFLAVTLIGAVSVVFWGPETKGVPLDSEVTLR
ncbi:MFS transporter [Aneurinibacillus sp. Ricciae_BoGa-3]|uniref:MFS transporter n=1 Tax=Aneurinibacillus sp. Ricciae_BoGa-3 TaxID=3022697 RepID=UPI00234137A2|nr:MFS transporter [Aneurinibacillus sp. Ricciae_BoGa-3]WCK56702.1 MFS transporter [Aneurinibacillus sp. Ricciae_BoGa-3]